MKNAAALVLLASFAGCALVNPKSAKDQAARDRFECEAKAIAPATGGLLDATDLLLDVYAGKADLRAVVTSVGATPGELAELNAELQACDSNLVPKADAGDEAEL